MSAYLKASTCLYHPQLAPEGRIFHGSDEKPVPHPGKGWVDTPAAFDGETVAPTADDVVAASAAAIEAGDKVTALQAEVEDLTKRAAGAEEELETSKTALSQEQEAHAATKAELATATADFRKVDAEVADLRTEAEKVPGLTSDLATVTAHRDELQNALAAFDHDHNGKPGGGAKGGKA